MISKLIKLLSGGNKNRSNLIPSDENNNVDDSNNNEIVGDLNDIDLADENNNHQH